MIGSNNLNKGYEKAFANITKWMSYNSNQLD